MGLIADQLQQTLENAIRSKGLLVWLDGDGSYTKFVDQLRSGYEQGAFPYPVFAFRGSFIELLQDSHPVLAGANVPKCVVHLPGFSEDNIKQTPLYEAYKAGQRWRIALDTVVREAAQGRVTPDQTDRFLAQNEITFEGAERFLAQEAETSPVLRTLLTRFGEQGLVVMLLSASEEVVSSFVGSEEELLHALRQQLQRFVGMDDEWEHHWQGNGAGMSHLVDNVWAFLLCLEYAGDMRVPPQSARLACLHRMGREFKVTASAILNALRRDHADLYALRSEETAEALQPGETEISLEQRGKIDTFYFEVQTLVDDTFELLAREEWDQAEKLASGRLSAGPDGTPAFWLQRDRWLRRLWLWVSSTAELGKVLAANEESSKTGPAELVAIMSEYTTRSWKVDQHHRRFVVQTEKMVGVGLKSQVRLFSRVRDLIEERYRAWIDKAARIWNEICETRGFLGPPETQQRFFFRDHVVPAIRTGEKTALILADALRWELGRELADKIQTEDIGKTEIGALLAELPTVTEVGMSALAPTVEGQELIPVMNNELTRILGFRGGQRNVTTVETRRQTFADVAGVPCGWEKLDEFLSLSDKPSQRVALKQLLVLPMRNIDGVAEGNAISHGVDYFETAISRIVTAVRRLVALGYTRILITADHGFILGDRTVETKRAPSLKHANRRYAIGEPRTGENLVSARLSELQYRTETQGTAVVFERSSHLLSSAAAGSFYHGGNTLQERVVPVLTISSRAGGRREGGSYTLRFDRLAGAMGCHRVRITAEDTSPPALFDKEPLEVRVLAEEDISVNIADTIGCSVAGDVVTLSVGKACEIYFTLSGNRLRARLSVESTRPGNTVVNPQCDEYFEVEPLSGASPDEPRLQSDASSSSDWRSLIDPEYHGALEHLQKHDNLSQRFLVNSLGGGSQGARKARRFAARLEEWRRYLPFAVEVHDSPEGKEYRKA